MNGWLGYYVAADPQLEDARRADEWRRLHARPDAGPLPEKTPIERHFNLSVSLAAIGRRVLRQA